MSAKSKKSSKLQAESYGRSPTKKNKWHSF
jgi:hypothetical protein